MRTVKRPLLSVLGMGLACAATAAEGQSRQNSGDLELAVSVVDGCTVSTTDVAFGLIIGTTGSVRATGAVDVQCTTDLDFSISMDRGLHNLGANRRMRNSTSGAFMRYALYSNPSYSSPWTDRRAGIVEGNSGSTGFVSLPVYGELTFDGTAVSGRYEDTVTVTIEF